MKRSIFAVLRVVILFGFALRSFGAPPPNDNFSKAEPLDLSTGPVKINSSNVGATSEVGEVSFGGLAGPFKSIWYRIPAATANITVSTAGSDFDTILSIYKETASGIIGLVPLYGNDNFSDLTSKVSFSTLDSAGDYYIAVDGYNGSQGHVVLSVTPEAVYEKIVNFTELRRGDLSGRGDSPGPLVLGNDGNFYGTTKYYGITTETNTIGFGTAFRVTPTGVFTTLVDFTGNGVINKGSRPSGKLVQGSDGNFYGTTEEGGANNFGTVFRMSPSGALATLVEFTGNGASNKGSHPTSGLIRGSDGNFYGTTLDGGASGLGTVFRVSPSGVLTTLVYFSGSGPDNRGKYPNTRLVQGSDGNFYGTTSGIPRFGFPTDFGTVFRMTPAGVLTTLVDFTGTGGDKRGAIPEGGLVQSSDGDFYGSTARGGASDLGTVFRMTPDGALTTLIDFTGIGGDQRGAYPSEELLEGVDGTFYGTTAGSGFGFGQGGNGTVFRMTRVGVLTTLVEFTYVDAPTLGRHPQGLSVGTDGNFYSTTQTGGTRVAGTVFKMTPAGALTTLVNLNPSGLSSTGANPRAPLLQGSDGCFYGTTYAGGAQDLGTVFKATPTGVLTTLVQFAGNGVSNKGGNPEATLIEGSDGNFYGTTTIGGAGYAPGLPPVPGNGTIFRMTSDGVLTTLVEFTGNGPSNKGSSPKAALLEGSDGYFYGTTLKGGASNNGTIFKMTPAGLLMTLVEFTGNGASNKGSNPSAALVLATDGNFYGTTESGGLNGGGTVFRLMPTGQLMTLVNFSTSFQFPRVGPLNPSPGELVEGGDGNFYGTSLGDGYDDYGTVFGMTPGGVVTTLQRFGPAYQFFGRVSPRGRLLEAGDGAFYGNLAYGGAQGLGSVFRITLSGAMTTVFDFSIDPENSAPSGGLIRGRDANLYGTTQGGSIYRLIFPGAPNLYPIEPELLGGTGAFLAAKANGRGGRTAISLEYGTDEVNFATSIPIISNLNGYQTTLIGTTLSGLTLGVKYYYRFRAVNAAGTTLSPVQSFATLAAPVVAIGSATEVGPASARLNGMVNARNFDTAARFEWGTDGNSFPNRVPAVPGTVTGNVAVAMSAPVAGLVAGQTYYYRLVTSNVGGTTVSGQESFRTLTAPIAALTGASPVSTTRARVDGTVNAQGSTLTNAFEYGTDGGTFDKSVAATPGVVSGEVPVPVTATLSSLTQGTAYYYRIRATGPGGTGVSTNGTFTLSILSGLVQTFPDPPPASTGTLTVNFDPPDKGAWRFAGEGLWRTNSVPAANLASGERLIEFIPLPGFIRPLEEIVDVISGTNQVLERSYFETPVSGGGSLTVDLKPADLASPQVPEATRAQWRFSAGPWLDSGVVRTGLPAGTYLVECKTVGDRDTPPPASVTIGDGDQRQLTLTYFRKNNPTGAPPRPLTFNEVSTDEDLPFAYVGQIRSDVGSSTGFVVKRRVVATAGHVVFDDGTLSYITKLQWLFQRHASANEPTPQVPRGYYLAAGYAAARTNAVPGEGTPASQNLDYAALYFLEEAGRGGFGGFLASEAMHQNEFLDSSADKRLAGYAIDGIPEADRGKLHATPVFTQALSPAFGNTWITSDVYGVGGCSGGPLFVRHSNGHFYPAAIYLGGSGQTVVRAIDRDVIELFNRAETSANGGDNTTSGGITHTEVTTFGSPTEPGSLKVIIEPEAARTNGGWRLLGNQTLRLSGSEKGGLTPGTYTLEFTTVAGFPPPPQTNIVVVGGSLKTITFTYGSVELEEWRMIHFDTTLNAGPAADGADPDGDGSINIDEFIAGTDPNQPSDVLRFLSASWRGMGFLATVRGKAGRIYQLQVNEGLSSANWRSVASVGPLLANVDQLELIDPAPPANAAFYRVLVSKPKP